MPPRVSIPNASLKNQVHHWSCSLHGHLLSSLRSPIGNMFQEPVTILVLELLRLQPQRITVSANLVLQTRNDTDRLFFLLAAQTIGSTQHVDTAHELGVPIVLL